MYQETETFSLYSWKNQSAKKSSLLNFTSVFGKKTRKIWNKQWKIAQKKCGNYGKKSSPIRISNRYAHIYKDRTGELRCALYVSGVYIDISIRFKCLPHPLWGGHYCILLVLFILLPMCLLWFCFVFVSFRYYISCNVYAMPVVSSMIWRHGIALPTWLAAYLVPRTW